VYCTTPDNKEMAGWLAAAAGRRQTDSSRKPDRGVCCALRCDASYSLCFISHMYTSMHTRDSIHRTAQDLFPAVLDDSLFHVYVCTYLGK
jgi:hypothetical protein